MSRATTQDISALTLAGLDCLPTLRSATYTMTVDTVEGGSIARMGASPQAVKQSSRIAVSLASTITGATRVSNLDVSALSIGAVSYLAALRGGTFSGAMTLAEIAAVSDAWKSWAVTGKSYNAEVTLAVPTTAMPAIVAAVHSIAGLTVVFTITINAVATTLPMLATSLEHTLSEGEIQLLRLSLVGRDPLAGAFPTAPIGTTTLLERAFNAPQLPISFVATTRATGGITYAGSALFESFSFGFDDGALVLTEFVLASTGPVTATPTV